MFKIGTILRYGTGSTALMKVASISEGHGGSVARYYGNQCMGGGVGAYHENVSKASNKDLEVWKEKKHWRE